MLLNRLNIRVAEYFTCKYWIHNTVLLNNIIYLLHRDQNKASIHAKIKFIASVKEWLLPSCSVFLSGRNADMHKHCASQKHSLGLFPCKHKELHTHGHTADTETFLYYNYYSSKKGTHGESNETAQPRRKSRRAQSERNKRNTEEQVQQEVMLEQA